MMRHGFVNFPYFALKGQSFAPARAKLCLFESKNVLLRGQNTKELVRGLPMLAVC